MFRFEPGSSGFRRGTRWAKALGGIGGMGLVSNHDRGYFPALFGHEVMGSEEQGTPGWGREGRGRRSFDPGKGNLELDRERQRCRKSLG